MSARSPARTPPLSWSGAERRWQRLGAGALGAVAVAALAGCAVPGYGNYAPGAGRSATAVETAAISRSVHSSLLTAAAGARRYRVTAIRVSASSPGYAFATIDPSTNRLDGAAAALRLLPSTGGPKWTVTQVGSAQVGCRTPVAIHIEFALHC